MNVRFQCDYNIIGIICSMHVDLEKSFQIDDIIRNLMNVRFRCDYNIIGIICSMHVDLEKSFQIDIIFFFLFLMYTTSIY